MTVHVFDTMGTTVSLRFPGDLPTADTLSGVEDAFRTFDLRFSLYRDGSEISRVARGEVPLHRSSAVLRDMYAEALEWHRRTAGAFTPHRPDGIIDLSGIVKAAAIEAGGRVLDAAGEGHWLLNAGGDILSQGTFRGAPWRVGVVDPGDRTALLCGVGFTGARRALATSGTAERGEHVWRVDASGEPTFRQVSVLADDIVTADVLATAILSGGPARCQEMLDRFDVDALIVDAEGRLTATPGLATSAGLAPA
ncbi:FAD:protein FMN transferase [Herbiconiux ginsengi]|uniref:FAD:protein FMN transferase n=1 Tax=Herbiconiux ginsengi TaxID=381665 RepID=A0A1H3QAV8_9MICO|nr:FAD:protein FMN transferase [Herbiconiux ginsengi]SDZ10390.1 thiamine biosynthesis lipoprotein [Herbiconiux ginsengi]